MVLRILRPRIPSTTPSLRREFRHNRLPRRKRSILRRNTTAYRYHRCYVESDTRQCITSGTTFVAPSLAARFRTLAGHMIYNQYSPVRLRWEGGRVGTGRFAVVAHATCVGSRFGAITREMSHLETIPAFDVFGIARFLHVKFIPR